MKIFPILFILFLVGCAEIISTKELSIAKSIPKYWENPLPESEQYTGAWWDSFQDTTLSRIFLDFQKSGPDILSISYRLKMAQQLVKINTVSKFPSVSAGLSGSSRKQNLAAFGFGNDFFGGGQGDGQSGGNGVTSFTSENYGLNLSMQWELDIWGRLFNQRKAFVQDYESAQYELSYLKFSLQIQLMKLFYSAVESMNQYQLAMETVASVTELAEMVSSRYEKGLRSSLDLRLTQSSVSTAKALLENRHQVYLLTVRNLQAMLGQYPDGNYALSAVLPDSLPLVPAGIPADILERRPDIKSAIAKAKAASHRSAEAMRSFLPGIILTGSLGTSSTELSDILNQDYQIWSRGSNVNLPLFQGGRLISNLKMSRASLELAEVALVQSIIKAFSEVEQTLFAEKSNKILLASYEDSAEQAEAAYKLSIERYDSGLVDLIAVLDSQQRWFQARSQVLLAKKAKIDTRLNLILALGGDIGKNIEK